MKQRLIKLLVWFIAAGIVATITLPLIQTLFPFIPKGGVGIIKTTLFVLTNSQANTILRGDGGKIIWTGQDATRSETLIADESGIYPFSWSRLKLSGSSQVFIRFTPNRIYFYEIGKCSGGHYPRRTEGKT